MWRLLTAVFWCWACSGGASNPVARDLSSSPRDLSSRADVESTEPAPPIDTNEPIAEPSLPTAEFIRDPETDALLATLPVLDEIRLAPAHIVIRGNLAPRTAAAMSVLAGAVIDDVRTRFLQPATDTTAPVDLCLFENDESYGPFAAALSGDDDFSWMGFYQPSHRVVVANLGRSVGNLRHELVHPLLGDDFPAIPSWLNEGLASLYGTSRAGDAGFIFLVNYRLRDVRVAQREGRLPTLSQIAGSGEEELYGEEGSTYYGTARYLLMYLNGNDQLEEFYTAIRDGTHDAQSQIARLEETVDYTQFTAWLGRQRIGSLPTPN